MKLLEITDANFDQEVLKSDKPVLIDFWAVWCGPCKAIAPIVEEIASEYEGKLKVGKVDVDANPMIASRLNIRSIPTVMVFRGGQIVEQIVGAVPKRNILEKVQPHLVG
jgi:thioredoxin 1